MLGIIRAALRIADAIRDGYEDYRIIDSHYESDKLEIQLKLEKFVEVIDELTSVDDHKDIYILYSEQDDIVYLTVVKEGDLENVKAVYPEFEELRPKED